MNPITIKQKSFDFAVRIVKLCSWLDETPGVRSTLSKQLIRSGTSIGANVAESQSAQSPKDFIHKMEIALKEARETEYWLKLLIASELVKEARLKNLLVEIDEIIRMLVSIVNSRKKI